MKIDARDVPLDEFEQETLERLLQLHAERSQRTAREQRAPGAVATPLPWRLGGRWWRRGIGLIAASLVAASGALAAVSIFGGSVSPVHLYGDRTLCPGAYDLVAELSTKLYYPPDYPGHLPTTGDVRCFVSARNARQAGFRLAATPSGDTRVGPIYFAPTPRAVRRTCQTAAREITAVVYCPGELPTPWFHPLVNWDCPTHDCQIPLLSLTGNFTAPDSYAGSAPGIGEAMIWEASAAQQHDYPYVIYGCSSSDDVVSRTSFRGHPAAWYRCIIWERSTGTTLEWHIGRQAYAISVEGPAATRRELVAFIAKHLIVVPPPK